METELSEITEKLRNNSKYTVMLGGDFNAANIDWDTGIVPDSTDDRLMKEKLVTVLAEAGLTQMQRDPTRGQNLLDLFCCNKPSLVKSCISIPGISDHSIVLADCNLKTPITQGSGLTFSLAGQNLFWLARSEFHLPAVSFTCPRYYYRFW